jgi:hypothetical protein
MIKAGDAENDKGLVVGFMAELSRELTQLAQIGGRFCDVSGRGVSRIKKLGSADS